MFESEKMTNKHETKNSKSVAGNEIIILEASLPYED